MSTAEDFLLLMTDPDTGKPLVASTIADTVFGGAILFDLIAAGDLTLDGTGRKARVIPAHHEPLTDPVLGRAFDRVRNRGRQTPRNVVARLGRQSRKHLYEALTARGAVQPRGDKALGIFPLTRHDVLDTGRRDSLVERIRASLVHEQPADAETGPLIGLLSAAGLTKVFVDKADRRKAKVRAKDLCEGDWASDAVRQAIQTTQTAMATALMAATIAGSPGAN